MNMQAVEITRDQSVRPVAECRLCGSRLKHTFVDLGMSPPCESFLRANDVDQMEQYFPLHVLVCENCFLVQLKEYMSAEFDLHRVRLFLVLLDQLGCACQGILRSDCQAPRPR